MIKWRFIAAGLLVLTLGSACEMLQPTATTPVVQTAEPNPYSAVPTHEREWLDITIEGIRIGIWLPAGWIADYQDGLIMAEHAASFRTSTPGNAGMLVYVFVPELDEFEIPSDIRPEHNMAWLVLDQAVHKPHMIGAAAASVPVGFTWNDFDAAYYLLTGPDGIQTLVIAVELPEHRLLVYNVSVPPEYVIAHGSLREFVSSMLDGMRVDGVTFSADDLSVLPDPLPFPPLPEATEEASTTRRL